MKSITARVSNPAIRGRRVASYKRVSDDATPGVCCECGETFNYVGPALGDTDQFGETPEAVACSHECARLAGFFPKRTWKPAENKIEPTPVDTPAPDETQEQAKTPKVVKPVDTEPCEHCNGPKNIGKRGYKHTGSCPKNYHVVRARVRKAKEDGDTECPFCQGGLGGRAGGYKHNDGCPMLGPKKKTETT